MTTSNDEKWINKKISRRDMLKLTGMGVAGIAIGASGFGGVMKAMGYDMFEPVADSTTAKIKLISMVNISLALLHLFKNIYILLL